MTRTVKKATERRKEIIRAARKHFQTKDYRKLTMQELMDKLGIAKGTLYHHFSSKGEILEAVVEDMVDDELTKKTELLKANKELSALEKLKLLVTEDSMARDNEQLLENLHHPDNALIHARHIARFLIRLAPLYAEVISEGCKEGVFKTEYPLECAEFLLAGVQFLTDVGFYPWDMKHLERRMNAFPVLIEAQLSAPKGSFGFLNKR
jgi:AcrR family transcriptional regulator